MSLPRYPEYKDSGVLWLGSVPTHWRVDRLKASITACKNGIWGDDPSGDSNDIECVRVADFDRARLVVDADVPTLRSVSEREREGRLLQRGDLLLEKSGGGEKQPVGQVVLYDRDVPAVCSNFVARVSLAPGMVPRFWMYQHAAAYASGVNVAAIKQTSGIQNLDQGQYFDERGAYPDEDEQHAIATFLDRETAKIDALIAEQEKLLALLAEKRQATISHVVTRGLNPIAPMKDSGIPWLGEVPAHWDVRRLKRLTISIEQGWSPQCESYPAEGVDEWGVLKVGCVNGGVFTPIENKRLPDELEPIRAYALKRNDLLISRANTRDLVGSAAVVPEDQPNLLLCDKLYRLRTNAGTCSPWFLAAFLGTTLVRSQIEIEATGASSSMLNIGQSTILELDVPLPPLEEQLVIVRFVADELGWADQLVTEAKKAISLLAERRGALISAAVTGKIDVRNAA